MSILDSIQVGLVHFMAYPQTMKGEGPVLETIKNVLTDEFFDCIEITHIADPATRAQAASLLAQSHITALYGAQPRFLSSGKNLNALDEEKRLEAQALLLDSIDEAAALGCKGVSFLAGKWEEATREQAFAQLLKSTRAACDHAKEKGLMVELEVFDYDLDKKVLIGPAPLALRFAQQMRMTHPNFGLLVDLSHLPQTHESASFALSVLRPFITHLHIGSCVLDPSSPAFGDSHPRFGFPGGVNDVAEVAGFLRVCQREGLLQSEGNPMVVTFEIKPQPGEDPDVIIAGAKRTLRRALASL